MAASSAHRNNWAHHLSSHLNAALPFFSTLVAASATLSMVSTISTIRSSSLPCDTKSLHQPRHLFRSCACFLQTVPPSPEFFHLRTDACPFARANTSTRPSFSPERRPAAPCATASAWVRPGKCRSTTSQHATSWSSLCSAGQRHKRTWLPEMLWASPCSESLKARRPTSPAPSPVAATSLSSPQEPGRATTTPKQSHFE
mmetsp:Transcript_72291/g.182891  ORF Transcript_72291/g.182891 Transcript_72291/m.182891 type:complete len:200 (+) Transcript_72291:91-690(+)